MFTDKVELKDFEKQDPEYQDLLRRVLAIQADCEIGGPNLYVNDILPNAPTKLDQLIVARTAAESDRRRMLEQQQGIGPQARFPLGGDALLDCQRRGVLHHPQGVPGTSVHPSPLAQVGGWDNSGRTRSVGRGRW